MKREARSLSLAMRVGYVSVTCMTAMKKQVEFPNLPLAVYRELAAHLRQVDGVEVELVPYSTQQFDYHHSQVGGLAIAYSSACDTHSQQRVEQILAYYTQRYAG